MHICMCPYASSLVLIVWTDKPKPVINIIHACMQSGLYRFPKPEELFKKVLLILRSNEAAVEWITDKGTNNVEDQPVYKDFVDALEETMRNVALSGSRLFKNKSIQTRKNWQAVDKWRKCQVVLYILRYVCVLLCLCMCPHCSMHVSLCLNACVLMFNACVLILIYMSPYVWMNVSLCVMYVSSF